MCLEVLSHVADQLAFLAKIADLLRPGDYLILATQNRPQLERNDVPPPKEGQIRLWVDHVELQSLLAQQFDIEEMFSLTPTFNRGVMRLTTSRKLNALMVQAGLGACSAWIKRYQEKAGLGWTLMALARKPG